jgi:predicted nucleic acid-binding protein
VLAALQRLQSANIGFADAYLAAGAMAENLTVASFDRDFDKLGVTRHEPSP